MAITSRSHRGSPDARATRRGRERGMHGLESAISVAAYDFELTERSITLDSETVHDVQRASPYRQLARHPI